MDRPVIGSALKSALATLALAGPVLLGSAPSASAAAASMQPAPRSTGPGPVVDPGVGDRPMGAGGRLLPTDLRQPVGFQQVFALPEGGFARQDGAITAVFPRSVYVNTRFGQRPVVPPGTVFRIGSGVPEWALGAQPAEAAEPALRIATASALGGDPRDRGLTSTPAPAFAAGTMFEDEFYRRVRVADLVFRASRADPD